jgi:hypothetical protein
MPGGVLLLLCEALMLLALLVCAAADCVCAAAVVCVTHARQALFVWLLIACGMFGGVLLLNVC